jgi:hypothetical protein
VLAKFFGTVRAMRDAWLAWPARIGPEWPPTSASTPRA